MFKTKAIIHNLAVAKPAHVLLSVLDHECDIQSSIDTRHPHYELFHFFSRHENVCATYHQIYCCAIMPLKTVLLFTFLLPLLGAFTPEPSRDFPTGAVIDRRGMMRQSFGVVLFPSASQAAMQNNQNVFKVGESLSITEAKSRFEEGRRSLDNLIQNYDEIARGGGDNVRRYLGTVGTTSGLYGIQKVMRALQEEADDIVEFTENMTDFEYYLSAADTAVYSANFVEYSAAKTKPEKFFADAKKDAEQMKVYMDRMAATLSQ